MYKYCENWLCVGVHTGMRLRVSSGFFIEGVIRSLMWLITRLIMQLSTVVMVSEV